MQLKYPFSDTSVERAFEAFPPKEQVGLLILRDLIFDCAAETKEVGSILEALKWGQPAYLTPDTKSGSTIRLGLPKTGGYGLYTHCQTTLISDFQALFPDDFVFEGNRAIHFRAEESIPIDKVRLLIKAALTYHLKK
ncbi:conserved hypothetical protein [Roseibium sp. TrichSKD4]|uniref:DUF1801 domain-containing protein n=1 Tax=Roseibium sp. TrichSKD4 TaxID=744980 RepID=UPI0001E5669F|nr:conserved hypothetical protein [Roseibium sp. TrichSKD4]